jgi:carotenoid 1,2-hydratase
MLRDDIPERYSFCSSLRADAWSDLGGRHSYQNWHFDAISDDGRESIIIDFYDNFILSPRFHLITDKVPAADITWPAVCIAYFADGRPILHATSEFPVSSVTPHPEAIGCDIGRSSFRADSAAYGSGFMVNVDLPAAGGRRIRTKLEWLSIESDLQTEWDEQADAVWNMTMPRADVSGQIEVVGRRGKVSRTFAFRGTGYHDHIKSRDLHYRDLRSRMWGRAHFTDATVVFERLGGVQDNFAKGRFILIKDGKMEVLDAACLAGEHKRDRWGLNVPRRVSYMSDNDVQIEVRPTSIVTSGISDVKALGDVTLELNDGKVRHATGIIEFVDPRRLGKRLYRLLTDLKTGRGERSGWI